MPILPRCVDQRLLERIQKAIGPAAIRLVFKHGASVSPAGVSPVATVVIQDRGTLPGLLRDPEISFGDAYADGRIEVEGDLVLFLEAVYQSFEKSPAAGRWYTRLGSQWLDFLQGNT